MTLSTDDLDGMYEEIYKNETNDIISINSDVAYTNVDFLNVFMGQQDIVTNVRGTSAETRIVTQGGDDKIFISSDADEDITTALTVDILHGRLDYIESDLYVESNGGRHRLLMSDSLSDIAKGAGSNGPAELTRSSLVKLADNLGNIHFSIDETAGDWYDGVTLWLGTGDDNLTVTSIPPSTSVGRTHTSVNAGNGSDTLTIMLEKSANDIENSTFVANGQVINAFSCSLHCFVFAFVFHILMDSIVSFQQTRGVMTF